MKTALFISIFALTVLAVSCDKKPDKKQPVFVQDSVYKLLSDSLRKKLDGIELVQKTHELKFAEQMRRLEWQQIAISTRLQMALDSSRAIDSEIETVLKPDTNKLTLFGL